MKFLDAFAGIGGFHAGITQAIPEAECVGMIEKDKSRKKKERQTKKRKVQAYAERLDKIPLSG